MIEPEHPKLSVARQCELLDLPRSTYYRRPEPESDENLSLMRVIDETYLAYPFFGSRQMTRWLQRQGYRVNRKQHMRRGHMRRGQGAFRHFCSNSALRLNTAVSNSLASKSKIDAS
jgi:putative transposase